MKKRIIATLLCAAMVISAFAGCSSGQDSQSSQPASSNTPSTASEEPKASGEGELQKFDDVKLDYLYCWNGGFKPLADQYNNDVSKAIRDKIGVTVEIEGAMMSESEKLNLMFASGDMPDIINAPYWGGTDACSVVLKKGATEGRLIDLKDKLVNYPSLNKAFEKGIVSAKFLENDLEPAEFKGGRYILPWQLPADAENETNWEYGIFVRDDVAKALNVDPRSIKTQDQLWDFMVKAKEHGFKDVNGNDTIPASTHQAGSNYYDYTAGFGTKKLTGYSLDSEKNVTMDLFGQDWLDNNMYIWKMVNSGILDKECFKQSNERAIEKIGNGTPLFVSMMYSWIITATKTTGLYESHPEMRYVPVGPLTYKDGSPLVQSTSDGRTGSPAFVFPTTCKNIDAALTWLEYLNTEEGARLASYGFEGDTYELNADGQPRMTKELTDRYRTDAATVNEELRQRGINYIANMNTCVDQRKTWWGEAVPFTADAIEPERVEYQKMRPVERIPGYPITALEQGFEKYEDFQEVIDGTVATDYTQRAFFAATEADAKKILEEYRTHVKTSKDGVADEMLEYLTKQATTRDDIVF